MATFALVPVQQECTFVSRYWVSCHGAPSGSTRWPLFFAAGVSTGLPLNGTTFVNASIGRRTPIAAIVAYAWVMSSGDTPPAPRITDGVVGRWSDGGMPSL